MQTVTAGGQAAVVDGSSLTVGAGAGEDRVRRTGHRRRGAVGDHRLERPGQPDVVRHAGLPEAARTPPAEGRGTDARRAPQGPGHRVRRSAGEDGGRRREAPGRRSVGNDGQGQLTGASVPPQVRPLHRLARSRRGVADRATWSTRCGSCWPAGEPRARRTRWPQLTGMTLGPSTPPQDPAVARLLPDFHAEDAELSAGLRVLHEPELIAAKDAAAVALLDSLPRRRRAGAVGRGDGEQLDHRAQRRPVGARRPAGDHRRRHLTAGRRGPGQRRGGDVRHLSLAVRGPGFAGHAPCWTDQPTALSSAVG